MDNNIKVYVVWESAWDMSNGGGPMGVFTTREAAIEEIINYASSNHGTDDEEDEDVSAEDIQKLRDDLAAWDEKEEFEYQHDSWDSDRFVMVHHFPLK